MLELFGYGVGLCIGGGDSMSVDVCVIRGIVGIMQWFSKVWGSELFVSVWLFAKLVGFFLGFVNLCLHEVISI